MSVAEDRSPGGATAEKKGVVLMMPGVRHYQTVGCAQTWAAYDALSALDGWKCRVSDETGAEWKVGVVNGRKTVVHAPFHPRNEEEGR